MKLTKRDFAAGIVAGIAPPQIITSARAQGATIQIGMCAPVTDPATESGGVCHQRRKTRARRRHVKVSA